MTRLAWNSTMPAPTKRMERKTPLRARGGSLFPKRRDRSYTEWIKTLPCVLFGKLDHVCDGPIDPCHVFRTRACAAYDRGEVVPGCRFGMHRKQEGRTEAFIAETGVNVRLIARALPQLYDEEVGRG